MANGGEGGDMTEETLETELERARMRDHTRSPEYVWNMDKTGSFWRGLPDTSLNQKGRRCRGTKQAKRGHPWAFSVNATGEKEDAFVIGKCKTALFQ